MEIRLTLIGTLFFSRNLLERELPHLSSIKKLVEDIKLDFNSSDKIIWMQDKVASGYHKMRKFLKSIFASPLSALLEWFPPEAGTVKFNVDGACNSTAVECGGVLRTASVM
ncbi:hypothetical protein GQ457_12G029180 [Hibiscus cannabinus]